VSRVGHVHLTTDLQTIYINLLIRVIVKQETKQKRNETKRNKIKQKRNEIQQKRNEAKKKSSINNKTKQTLTKRCVLTLDNNSQNASGGLKYLYNLPVDLAMEEKNNQDFIYKSSPLSCFLCAM
jgi:hypothetical protein